MRIKITIYDWLVVWVMLSLTNVNNLTNVINLTDVNSITDLNSLTNVNGQKSATVATWPQRPQWKMEV